MALPIFVCFCFVCNIKRAMFNALYIYFEYCCFMFCHVLFLYSCFCDSSLPCSACCVYFIYVCFLSFDLFFFRFPFVFTFFFLSSVLGIIFLLLFLTFQSFLEKAVRNSKMQLDMHASTRVAARASHALPPRVGVHLLLHV